MSFNICEDSYSIAKNQLLKGIFTSYEKTKIPLLGVSRQNCYLRSLKQPLGGSVTEITIGKELWHHIFNFL